MSDWWSAQTAAYLGAGLGAGVGIVGGGLGALIGVLAPRGKCKLVVVGLQFALAALGIVLLALGLTACMLGQPYHVYFPLLLVGFILAVVLGGLIPVTLSRYRHVEQRRMQAEEFRRT